MLHDCLKVRIQNELQTGQSLGQEAAKHLEEHQDEMLAEMKEFFEVGTSSRRFASHLVRSAQIPSSSALFCSQSTLSERDILLRQAIDDITTSRAENKSGFETVNQKLSKVLIGMAGDTRTDELLETKDKYISGLERTAEMQLEREVRLLAQVRAFESCTACVHAVIEAVSPCLVDQHQQVCKKDNFIEQLSDENAQWKANCDEKDKKIKELNVLVDMYKNWPSASS